LDVKRGDAGSANAAYAASYPGDGAPIRADAITVHPCLGLAAMGEFARRAHQSGACLLIVTRSSNPGAQGGTPADVAAAFPACPARVIPSASRSLLWAGPGIAALRDAAARLNAEFRARLGRAPDEQGAPRQ
jgi:orotidine-5'-phosphate decarboxylase